MKGLNRQKWLMSFLSMGLKKKTVLFVMGIYSLGMLVSIVVFHGIYRNMQEQSVVQQIEKVGTGKEESIQKYVSGLEDLVYNVSYSNWMQDVFQKKVTPIRMAELEDNARDFLCSLSTLYEGNQFAAIALRGNRITGTQDYRLDYEKIITEEKWYEQLLTEGIYVQTGEGTEKGIYRSHPEWDMTVYYRINDYNTLETTGFFVITIPMKNWKNLLENSYDDVAFVLETDDGTRISRNLSGIFFDKLTQNEQKLEKTDGCINLGNGCYAEKRKIETEFFQWNLITLVDTSNQKLENPMLIMIFVGMLCMTAALLLIVAVTVSQYLTKPILRCRDAMLQIKENQLGITLNNTYRDEIGDLIQGFNDMSGSLETLVEKNRMISALQKEAELKNLERQINPHFLFNTLEIINSLILSKKEQSAMLVCETLGKLYHYNLRTNKWITLRDELEYTRQYLVIMKYKINDLTVIEEADADLMELPFLKMILQPVVENSIKHGFEGKNQECCVSILVEKKREIVRIELMDNGNGMSEDAVFELQEEIQDIKRNPMQHLPESSHIGVKNVAQRLFLEYGEHADVKIKANAGFGTRVVLQIPIRE